MPNNVKPYNIHSKHQDEIIDNATDRIVNYCNNNFKLPDDWEFDKWKRISFRQIYDWCLNAGWPTNYIICLLKQKHSGETFSIVPDGGIIVAIKKDEYGNILDWKPLLSVEGKYQDSNVGNAVERYFKNYGAFRMIYESEYIFPYICFGEGDGMKFPFIQSKFIIGMGNDINKFGSIKKTELTFKNGKVSHKEDGKVYIKECGNWEEDEDYGFLLSTIKESVCYFFPENNNNIE